MFGLQALVCSEITHCIIFPEVADIEKKDVFTSKLLIWHETNQEIYPWRSTSDPYVVLISELLLRKTTRKQVKKVFATFFSRFPNIQALGHASECYICETINHLGMEHIKAAALKKTAEVLMQDYGGKIPSDKKVLLSLPNVGLYTANAVLVFAYNKQEPLLDTNIFRVVSRVFSFKSEKERPRDDTKMWKKIEELIPLEKSKDFYWAVLDFADSICLLKKPKCSTCFFLEICDYGNKKVY